MKGTGRCPQCGHPLEQEEAKVTGQDGYGGPAYWAGKIVVAAVVAVGGLIVIPVVAPIVGLVVSIRFAGTLVESGARFLADRFAGRGGQPRAEDAPIRRGEA